jgi:hypothetical protein
MTGGKREGAGRKPLPPGEKRVPVCVKLKPETAQRLRELAAERGISQAAVLEGVISGGR